MIFLIENLKFDGEENNKNENLGRTRKFSKNESKNNKKKNLVQIVAL